MKNDGKEFKIKKSAVEKVEMFSFKCPACEYEETSYDDPTVNPDFGCDICGAHIVVEDWD